MNNRHDRYILIGQTAVPEPDLLKWGEWFETADRIVAKTEVGSILISTVFLGLDHAWHDGAPLLFETMVFSDTLDALDCWRCSTWAEAEAQHARVVERMKQGELSE